MFNSARLFFASWLALAHGLPNTHPDVSTRVTRDDIATPDIDAIKAVPTTSFTSYSVGNLVRGSHVASTTDTKRWTCDTVPIFTWGDADNGGLGITITNADTDWRGFYIYYNNVSNYALEPSHTINSPTHAPLQCDNYPYKYIWINAGETEFVSLPAGFQGRMTRGQDAYNLDGSTQLLATWFEFSFDAANWMWADVSLIRGCDGGALIWSLDNSGGWKGFTQWILDGAPSGAYGVKTDGEYVINYTENNDASINTVPRDWDLAEVGSDYVYVDDAHGSPVIASTNGRMGSYWPAGRV